ncbi:MAG TPA: polysaccharide deacetylase family protein [Acidobacteriaceae bacterium]|jgi:peptidoglycan/xylan/chitin deacetylase (PgdA/CDA1 family)|nr:polysaccharide deacetylase family protein [Acidobacteriaceae bacterium]
MSGSAQVPAAVPSPVPSAAATRDAAPSGASHTGLAITFDDLPVHSALPPGETRMDVARQLLKAIKDAHLPPIYGMVNGVWTERQPETIEVLRAWRAAGEPLGSHTWTHMPLNSHSAEEWEADALKNEPLLEQLTKAAPVQTATWHYLRYPNLQEGDTAEKRLAVRAWLKEHGYTVAEVTSSFGDYNWNEPYARCMTKGDQAGVQRLHDTYLAAAHQNMAAYVAENRAVFGHDVPQVLLMHIGAFDARMFPELVRQMRADGFRFVSLEEAQKDPAYATPLSEMTGRGTLGDMVAPSRGVPLTKRDDYTKELAAMCR